MKTITRNEFKNICRLCLALHRSFKSISTNSIITMIEECAPVHVSIGDELPQLICQECFELLKKIILFRKTSVESEMKLYQACNEDPDKIDILENKPDTSNQLQPKIETFNELPSENNHETIIQDPIKTEEENISLKAESDDDENAIDSDPDINNDDSDSDYEPLVNLKNKKESNQSKKRPKKHYYECEYKCGKTVGPYFDHYERHLKRIHKPKLKRCPHCPRKMYSELFFQKHIDKHNELTCTHCQKVFLQQKPFDKHLLSHGVYKPYACSHCDGTFQSKFNLNAHIKRVHFDSTGYVECPECHKKMRKGSLRQHMKIHDGRNVFNCPDCEKTFFYKETLRKHQQIVHENKPVLKKFLCNLCGAATKNESLLARHLKVHSDEKPHTCSECNKSYKTACHLKIHIRNIHLNIRSHVCSVCGLGFFNARILSNHQRTHTGEKPFICEICDTAFSFKAGLYLHMKAHHNIPKPVNLPKFY